MVLANVLWKNLEVFQNYIFCLPLSIEQINLILFSQILAYFFCCHSLLNQCLQKGHWLESAWWFPRQLEHLKECRHSSPFFVSRQGGFVFLFTLQHYPNSWWFLDLWEPLHLMHLEPWILQEKVTWPHFQQFLHWGMPRFILVLLTIAIYLPTLKQWLIRHLALLPLWMSHISIYMIDMSDLGNTLIILGFDVVKDLILLKNHFYIAWVKAFMEFAIWVVWDTYNLKVWFWLRKSRLFNL